MLICNVTVKVIGGGGFNGTEEADMGRLLLVMGAPEVLHEMRLLPETVQAKDAFIRSHSGVGPQVDIDVGFGGENDAADRALGLLPRLERGQLLRGEAGQIGVGVVVVIVIVVIFHHFAGVGTGATSVI